MDGSHFQEVLGSKIHYIEMGKGDPILLLHGMPTSSYVWRNIIPHLAKLGRCIAPDFIGMGKSDKPNIHYSIEDHIQHIEKFITNLNLENLTLVLHGWGSIVGFHYAMNHPKNCKGLVFYEAYLQPINNESVSLPCKEQLYKFHDEEFNQLLDQGSHFIEKILPQEMMRELSSDELAHYREPFLTKGSGKPLQQYIKELSGNNDSTSKVNQLITDYKKQLIQSNLPKLMLYSIPGFITPIETVMWAKKQLPNIEIAEIGEEYHFAQESNPTLMGETISVWLQGVEQHVTV